MLQVGVLTQMGEQKGDAQLGSMISEGGDSESPRFGAEEGALERRNGTNHCHNNGGN